ncbi:hypothetical protein BDY19DRAFT_909858 [Irpex rosettiformis]|uniref:Uncharacterized protein n=1 Tax=Irpex rosettiformis TaxID=378272 RepID=A0ACB8TQN9_9APHY|nr:hypothetical protein BDY19DRAFT_909858 [Irpex rosettiformis]
MVGMKLRNFSMTTLVLWLGLGLGLMAGMVRADPGDRLFLWTFGGNFVASELTECQTLPIQIKPLTSNSTYTGVGPYYMFAFEPGGVPSVAMIGEDPKKLTWQNTHKSGSTLMLTVMDSNQTMGGVSSILYNVTAGTNTSCLFSNATQQPSSIPTITPNITGTIQTCDQWGLTISGGKSPYQMVFSAVNSPTITNSSMALGDDVYTYANRADPGQWLMASVVDADGNWGISTPVIMPFGSKDVTCRGHLSSSKTTAEIKQEAQDRATQAAQEKKKNKNVVIGVCIAVGVVAVIGLSVGLWWFMRWRARRGMGTWETSQDVLPRAWYQHGQGRQTDAGSNGEMQEGHVTPHPLLASKFSGQIVYTPLQDSKEEDMDAISSTPAVYGDREPGPTSGYGSPTLAVPLTARERKMLEVRGGGQYGHGQHDVTNIAGPSNRPRERSAAASRFQTASSSFSAPTTLVDRNRFDPDVDGEPEIIIQHRDAGTPGVVHELPPPYADRSQPSHEVSSFPS